MLELRSLARRAVRSDEFDTANVETTSMNIAVVGPVCDHPLRVRARASWPRPRDTDPRERRLEERDLCRRGRGNETSQRKTLAVARHHSLRTLSPLGATDSSLPPLPARSSRRRRTHSISGALFGPTPPGTSATSAARSFASPTSAAAAGRSTDWGTPAAGRASEPPFSRPRGFARTLCAYRPTGDHSADSSVARVARARSSPTGHRSPSRFVVVPSPHLPAGGVSSNQ